MNQHKPAAAASLSQEGGSFCSQFDPLCGNDGGFTEASIRNRLPQILRSMCSSKCGDAGSQCNVCKLAGDIASDKALPILPARSSQEDEEADTDTKWRSWIADFLHLTWQSAPWFVVETYAYRLLLQAVPAELGDPFRSTKQAALAAARLTWDEDLAALAAGSVSAAAGSSEEQLLHCKKLLLRSLWGNRADLSLSGGKVLTEHLANPHAATSAHGLLEAGLLCDDSEVAVELLMSACHSGSAEEGALQSKGACSSDSTTHANGVMMFADNAGLELLCDLMLIAWLLQCGARCVTLALKPSPILVSDAMRHDLDDTLQWMREIACSDCASAPSADWLQETLSTALQGGRLQLLAPQWTVSPLAVWQVDAELQGTMNSHAVVVFKGDANYRRLLGDRRVPFDTPTHVALDYLQVPTVALRTAKSGVMCGVPVQTCIQAAVALQPAAAAELDACVEGSGGGWSQPLQSGLTKWDKWLTAGHFGQIQVGGCSGSGSV